MAVARELRDERETNYNKAQLAGQVFYRYFATVSSSYLAEYSASFPWNLASYGANYYFNGELIRLALDFTTQEYQGTSCKAVAKRLTTSFILPGLILGGAWFGSGYVNAMYVVDWRVSENKALQKFADLISEPATGKLIFGTASYVAGGALRIIGEKTWEYFSPNDPTTVLQYPNLNLYQRGLSYFLNLGISLASAKAGMYWLIYSGSKLRDSTHINMGFGLAAYLLDTASQHCAFVAQPLASNVPKTLREVDVSQEAVDRNSLVKPSLEQSSTYTGRITAYHLLLVALMAAIYELESALDKENHLSDFPRLLIAMAPILLMAYQLREITPRITNCVGTLFAPSHEVTERTPINGPAPRVLQP